LSGSEDDLEHGATVDAADPALADTRASSPARGGVSFAPGKVLGDRYRIKRLLGVGGTGSVYLADDLTLGKDVALKMLHGDDVRGLRDEVVLAQKVTHRNVCRTYDLEEVDGKRCIKMEYVAGESLAVELARSRRLGVARVMEIVRAVCEGLDAAHREGVVHRDLKPQNIVVEAGTGRIVLMDFGIARAGGAADRHAFAGSPAYMAPEQFGGDADKRSDLYSLGCLIVELLTGHVPFPATTIKECERRHREDPPPPVAGAPAWLVRGVHALMEKDPTRRPSSARAVVELLRPPRRRWPWIAGAAFAIGAAAAAIVVARHHRPEWRPVVRDLPVFEEAPGYMAFSPDGRSIAYASDRGHRGRFELLVDALDGSAPRRLGVMTSFAPMIAWDPGGFLYSTDEDMNTIRVPSSGGPAERLAAGPFVARCGDELVILRPGAYVFRGRDGGERTMPIGGALACDSRGQNLAIVDGDGWLVVERPDGSDPRKLVQGAVSAIFSSNDRSIIYESKDFLYEISTHGGATRRLTSDDGPDAMVSVSPNGASLAYSIDQSSWDVVAVRGDAVTKLNVRTQQALLDDVSSDGKHLLVTLISDQGPVLAVFPTDEPSEGKLLTVGPNPEGGKFSPDGRRVVYGEGGDLMSIPIDGGRAIKLASEVADEVHPMGSVDGAIYVQAIRGQPGSRREVRPVIVALDGSVSDALASPPWLNVLPAADGQNVFERYDGNQSVAQIVPRGQAPVLDGPSIPCADLSISADGRFLLCTRSDGVHRVEIATGGDVLQSAPTGLSDALLGPDGTLYGVEPSGSTRRRIITNFAARPRP
jgi:serine/threonine-protein kinase